MLIAFFEAFSRTILAHHLLKNSVASDEYVLMIEAAFRDIEFPMAVEIVRGEERDEGFGAVVQARRVLTRRRPADPATA